MTDENENNNIKKPDLVPLYKRNELTIQDDKSEFLHEQEELSALGQLHHVQSKQDKYTPNTGIAKYFNYKTTVQLYSTNKIREQGGASKFPDTTIEIIQSFDHALDEADKELVRQYHELSYGVNCAVETPEQVWPRLRARTSKHGIHRIKSKKE